MTIFIYLYDRFFKSNRNCTTEHVKTVKILGFPGFFSKFLKFQFFFCLNCQIPGFSRYSGNQAVSTILRIIV